MTQPLHRQRRQLPLLAIGTLAFLLLALFLLAPSALAWWARREARERLREGAANTALDWLAWSTRFAPGDGRADLIRAKCYRLLQEPDRAAEALRSAEEKGAPAESVERETRLAQIQSGNLPARPESELMAMIEAGAPQGEVCAAFVLGFLARSDARRAKEVLDAWSRDLPDDPSVHCAYGVYWRAIGETARARESLSQAVTLQPDHELARATLATLLEEQGELQDALAQRYDLATRHPGDAAMRVRLARLLRKMGRADEARAVVEPMLATGTSDELAWEAGRIALDLGDYEQARTRFNKTRQNQPRSDAAALDSAFTLALQGKVALTERRLAEVTESAMAVSLAGTPFDADPTFRQLNSVYDRLQTINDLRARLAAFPNDVVAARQLMALTSEPPKTSEADGAGKKPETGPELYARHCAACHGADGNGDGRAARHLYPRPKDLRSGNYRLVRTLNGVPTLQDLESTIRRGMPGASMPPFDDLDPSQVTMLAKEVQRLHRAGIREQLLAWLGADGDEIDEEELQQSVEELTTPGEPAPVPRFGPADAESIARGRILYDQMGCMHCHGEDGSGPSETLLVDDELRLTSSRDLAHEPLKGGEEPESIYLRIVLGMPGTPHPACTGLSDEELIDLVHFCRSLRQEPFQELTNHERMLRATRVQ